MTMNILAILISLAMMLTGAGGEGQPAEASRMMVIHDVNITYNDESVTLDPALWLGAYANGEKAVYDLSLQVNNESLFPMQLGVDDTGITALFEKSDVAVKVSAEALEALTGQLNQAMEAMQAQMAGGENAEVMNFIMQEFIPAYTGLLNAVQDPEFQKELEAQSNAIFAEVIDRGEGTPVTVDIEGTEYALNMYTYTITSEQMAELCDKVFSANDVLKNYYDAMFKLYSLMPEESGLKNLTSFQDLFGKTGMAMTMDVTEQLSDDEVVDLMDAVMTIDMSGMIANIAAQNGEAEVPADVQIAPIEMNISTSKVGDLKDTSVQCQYEVNAEGQNAGFDMTMTGHSESENDISMDVIMNIIQDGETIGNMSMTAGNTVDEETGDGTHSFAFNFESKGVEPVAPGMNASLQNSGISYADGTSSNSVAFSMTSNGVTLGVSFDVDVQTGELGDLATGHEAALTIDDLSQEAMANLQQDQNFQAALMQVYGSLMSDAQTLTADESVQKLVGLFTAMRQAQVEAYDYSDDSFEGEETGDYEYQEPEDDGVLAFNQPTFTWLPEGWELQDEDIDTAYDWVSQSFSDGTNYMYATFYQDYGSSQVNYVVGEDGSIQPIEGREVSISDFGDDSLSVTIREADVLGNLNLYGEEMDVETIGQIVAGIQF